MFLSLKKMLLTPLLKQRGSADLFMAIIILAVLALSAIFVTKFVILDMRTTANIKRYSEALVATDYALEQAVAYLNENAGLVDNTSSWTWIACTDANSPCGNGTNQYYPSGIYVTVSNQVAIGDTSIGFTTYYVSNDGGGNKPEDLPLITILTIATSDSGLGQAVARMAVRGLPLLSNSAPAPLVASGNVNGSGAFRLWGYDKDGAGSGNPLSIWSASNVNIAGNIATIDPNTTPYDPNQNNPNAYDELTYKQGNVGVDGLDVVANDGNFPGDLFQYFFGVPDSERQQIKDQAIEVTSCDSITTGGFYWVTTGNECAFSGNTTYGSSTDPILVVVDDGQLKINANVEFYGMIYKRGTDTVQVNGGPVIYGALVLDSQVDLGNGNVDLVYDSNVLQNLNKNNKIFAPLNGSWNDDY